jgi:ornithine decarboxylase
MNFVQRFTFLFSAPTFEAEDLEGMRVAEIITAIQRLGFQVIRAPRIEDAETSAACWSIGARRVWKGKPPR